MTQQFDNVKAQVARMQTAVAKEIQQLADALDLAKNADDPAAIQDVADQLRAMADGLEADDPAPAPG